MNIDIAVHTINMAMYDAMSWFAKRGETEFYIKICNLQALGPFYRQGGVSDEYIRCHLEFLAEWLSASSYDHMMFTKLHLFHSSTKDAIRSLHNTCFHD